MKNKQTDMPYRQVEKEKTHSNTDTPKKKTDRLPIYTRQ